MHNDPVPAEGTSGSGVKQRMHEQTSSLSSSPGILAREWLIPAGLVLLSALRVFDGQLPHRDFAEVYTGGLSFLGAATFRLFGVNLFSLRIAVFSLFLVWIPVVYFIARRCTQPRCAALITAVAISWSYPNYVAAMPSWYNLFLATFGAAALLRYLENGSWRWLFLGGVFGGLSIAIKIIGLYYIAAVLLCLLFLEQTAAQRPAADAALDTRCPVYRITCAAALLLFLAALTRILLPQFDSGSFYHFLLPAAACVALLLLRERHPSHLSSPQRFGALLRPMCIFLLGTLEGILPLLLPYLRAGAVHSLLRGVLGSTSARIAGLGGRLRAPGAPFALYGLATLALVLCAMYAHWTRRPRFAALLGVMLALVLLCSAYPTLPLQDTWLMGGMFTPIIVLFGAGLLAFVPHMAGAELQQARLMLFLGLAALCSLVQYPVPWVTYFCYTAPFTLFATVAVVTTKSDPPGRTLLAITLTFFLGLGCFGLIAKHIYNPDLDTSALHRLALPRAGGLQIDATTPGYEELIPFLQSHAGDGLLLAGNDCPELYFLSGLRNPTRDDTGISVATMRDALHSSDLRLVTLNDNSFFATGAIAPAFRATIQQTFPNTRKIGHFSIYWR